MKKPCGRLVSCLLSVIAFFFALTFPITPAHAQVKAGDKIAASNAEQVRALVSPGAFEAVSKGMEMNIVAPSRVDWPPPYQDATEKYSGQVRLGADNRDLMGYVAGQPFPLLDPNDPNVATKIMWNQYFKPIASDDFDLRFFECQVAKQTPGADQSLMQLTEIGHLAGFSDIGRTEVEPRPADPDFQTTAIWQRSAAYPTLAPSEDRGSGAIRYRYWDANHADDAWAFLAGERRVRRVSEVIMSSSPGLSTWDADHAGGFGAKPQEYNFKYLGDKNMLGCAPPPKPPPPPAQPPRRR